MDYQIYDNMIGKTTTSEQMLFACGALKSVGRVDSGDTVMDFLPQGKGLFNR